MKATEFSKVLRALAELASDSPTRAAVQQLSQLLDQAGSQTVAQVCKRLQSLPISTQGQELAWSRSVLARYLASAQTFVEATKSKSAAADFAALVSCLRSGGSWSLESWFQAAREQLAQPTKRTLSGAKKSPSIPVEQVVDDYLKRLSAAEADRSEFESILETLRQDKRATVAAVRDIGARYSHLLKAAKLTRPKVLEAIRQDFFSRLRTRNELDIAVKVKPW